MERELVKRGAPTYNIGSSVPDQAILRVSTRWLYVQDSADICFHGSTKKPTSNDR
jgi:hypothetical protein